MTTVVAIGVAMLSAAPTVRVSAVGVVPAMVAAMFVMPVAAGSPIVIAVMMDRHEAAGDQ